MHDVRDYEISIRYSWDDECFVAKVKNYEWIAASGGTVAEAAKEIQPALAQVLAKGVYLEATE